MLSALGGEAVADYAYTEARNPSLPLERRVLALDLAENVASSGARRHADQLAKLATELRRENVEAPTSGGKAE